jgi:hypothetical protein
MTMNGGTSLRLDGRKSRFAASSIVFGSSALADPPRCCRIRQIACKWPFHDPVVIASRVDRPKARH